MGFELSLPIGHRGRVGGINGYHDRIMPPCPAQQFAGGLAPVYPDLEDASRVEIVQKRFNQNGQKRCMSSPEVEWLDIDPVELGIFRGSPCQSYDR